MFGAGPRWKYFSEAVSLVEDEAAWVTKARTVSEEEPSTPVGNGEGEMGPGESDEPQWSGAYEYSERPETLEGSVGRGIKTSVRLEVSVGPERAAQKRSV